MNSTASPSKLEQQLRAMNEALLIAAVKQHELTEQAERAEAALRESERRQRFVMDSIPQKIFTARPNGDVDYFNPQWTEFTGLSFEQIKGWGWKQFIHPDDLEETVRLWQRAVASGEFYHQEHRFRRADGEYRWHVSRAQPMGDETGRVFMWVGSNTEVHDIKQAEAALRVSAEALADLHRGKDEFLAMLSHELRNPLAPLANAVHLVRLQKNEDPLQQQARTIIERQVTQLTRLVDDLMEVSRITTGRVQLRHDRIVMSGVVEHAVETVGPLMIQRGHEFTVSLPGQPIWLDADAARLQQVLVNLLTNAAKYTDVGGHIWLTVERASGGRQPPDEEVILRVRDTGVGIAPELLPHIFDLFTQAERSLDRSQGGLGIGLALVHRLVEMHHGRVEVFSALGRGSEFVVHLPATPTPTPRPPPTPEATAESAGPSLRVLVVDDNVDSTGSLALLLTLSRHEVRTAHDGLSALEAAVDFRPDVVLLDIGLPKMDGYEVAKRLRQAPALKNVLLIAMTGYGHESDRQHSREAGFDHHLIKPVDFDQLQHILAAFSEKAP